MPRYETVDALGRFHVRKAARARVRGVTAILKFLKDESGATAIEYGLIAALVSIVIITGALALGGSLKDLYEMLDSKVSGAIP